MPTSPMHGTADNTYLCSRWKRVTDHMECADNLFICAALSLSSASSCPAPPRSTVESWMTVGGPLGVPITQESKWLASNNGRELSFSFMFVVAGRRQGVSKSFRLPGVAGRDKAGQDPRKCVLIRYRKIIVGNRKKQYRVNGTANNTWTDT